MRKAGSVADRKTKRCLIFDAYDKCVCVIILQIGSYSGLDSSPHNIARGNQRRTRPVYLVYGSGRLDSTPIFSQKL